MNGPGAEIPRGHLNIIDALLARYSLERLSARAVDDSVLNDNYRVETGAGTFFARIHATRRDRERIGREHRVATWVRERGEPAVAPLVDAAGQSLHRIGGAFASLYPWVEGRCAQRGSIGERDAAALGGLLGRLHALLRDYPDDDLESGKTGSHWSTADAINMLGRVDDLIRYYPAMTELQLRVLEDSRHQLGLLESGAARPSGDFSDLARQPCHGDFHERNVLLGEQGEVLGIVDWELVSLLPPVYELIRTLTFLGLLDAPLPFRAFMSAYREVAPLDRETCIRGVEMRWQATLHDTWAYRAYFVEGNRRAARFFDEHAAAVRRFSDLTYRSALARLLSE